MPEDWQFLWSGPLKTIDYLKSFAVRAQASVNRYRISWSSEKPEDFIDEIDLTTVFNGSSLLTTFGLISSKWLKTPLKDLVLKSTLRKQSSINSKTNERYESQNIDGQQMQLQLKSIKVIIEILYLLHDISKILSFPSKEWYLIYIYLINGCKVI